MKNIFNSVQIFGPKRNRFDLSHGRKFSCDMGKLIPIGCMEVLPSDKITLQTSQMIRFAPLIFPMMHQVDVYTHHWFVPNRILWDNWETFITGGKELDTPQPVFPTISWAAGNPANLGTLGDYLGLPVHPPSMSVGHALATDRVNALPFYAYRMIYDQFYRDQNLQNSDVGEDGLKAQDGDNDSPAAENNLNAIMSRNWEHDYFTGSLPFAQKGDEALLPLGTTAEIDFVAGEEQFVKDMTGTNAAGTLEGASSPTGRLNTDLSGVKASAAIDLGDSHVVDLSTATASSINDLRRAFKLQEWLEKNARGGTRYFESLLVHFGMRNPDSRLQRPEYLGGGKSPVSVSEVLQTSESVNTPQGNMSGHGINVGQSHSFTRTFEEHGFIISIMSVMPKPCYQQGLHKQWLRTDKFDYAWPTFDNIGEQPVQLKEIFAGASSLTGSTENIGHETFGYVPRYAEYRYIPTTVHGDYRDTLNYAHMGRIFGDQPRLNSDFIKCDPTDRVFAVQDIPDDGTGTPDGLRNWNKLYCMVYNKITALRPLSLWGTPSI